MCLLSYSCCITKIYFQIVVQAPWGKPCKLAEEAGYICKDNMCVMEPQEGHQTYHGYKSCHETCELNGPEKLKVNEN